MVYKTNRFTMKLQQELKQERVGREGERKTRRARTKVDKRKSEGATSLGVLVWGLCVKPIATEIPLRLTRYLITCLSTTIGSTF